MFSGSVEAFVTPIDFNQINLKDNLQIAYFLGQHYGVFFTSDL